MRQQFRTWLVLPVALTVLTAPGQALAAPAVQMGGDWRKMTPKMATTKTVEAMVLKNDLIRAEVRGNFAFGYGETAAVVVHAAPDGDGSYLTVVAVSTDDGEAERLRNAVRAHVFDGPYDDTIPHELDSKKSGRRSTAPAVRYAALQLADKSLLYRAVVRSGLAYRGLNSDIQSDGLIFGTNESTVACLERTRSATGKANVLIVVASSKKEEATDLRDALAENLKGGKLAPVVSLCKDQTAIRDQAARDVCPYFPAVAALEAAYRRTGVEVDLSAEHLIWLRNVTSGGDRGNRTVAENLISTLGGGGLATSFGVLRDYAICPAKDLPYRGDDAVAKIGQSDFYKGWGLENYDWSTPQSQFVLNRWNLDPRRLPQAARASAKYGIDECVMLSAGDAKRPEKFEEILASGREVVFNIRLHENSDDGGKGEPVWRYKPAEGVSGNHLMLVVGYDRERRFFIVKNSWGPTNYTAMREKLAPNWKDIEAYNGYTLVDYNYLDVCSEAGYIKTVAPLDSPRFAAQRALGQWQVTFEHKDKKLMTGVLAWRHNASATGARVGDLVTEDGQQFRVNVKLEGDGTKPYKATLAIDFAKGTQPYGGLRGAAWSGKLALPTDGRIAMALAPAGGDEQKLWGAPSGEVRLSAHLVADKNLLRAIKPPAELLRK
ncbi:C1 family peptidase [Frigoriglobus tundricola]|uniref:Peptidase C1A papain C-terminal domain-containing protein n=1 Tax=Frigoriglobus tundricola TaxID=2774151 RepID=A0A6M5YWF5_9BACT|nr:C1 family peptidase [Frigoriglobus tundricola]QJW98279.1 hypothetical protein FTUN_5867 [Frigoriglobus tundricola]